MKTPLPPVLRAALYRRAVACAWLTVCERQHRYPHLTLESLEAAIAAELEGFYLRQHGEEKGRQIACALLEDLMESGPLKAAPSLSFLGLVVMQKFSDPMLARSLLQSQQNSDEALNIKRDADPTFDFIGYLETLPQTSGMYMGNASIIPRNYRKYLYHAYLAYMEANGYRNVLSLKMFGLGLPVMLKEYGLNYEKRHTKQGIQTNLTLKEESYGDWLPKCDDPATA
ncbi:DUF5375 family protein [Escherichia coli]|nr:DUF5375 family protein [Escherichia coli]MDY8967777.1 DUF5375 family protein [Escherichia coli]MDY9018492.1 DUF5375 family protein [Escherichia coli]MDY9045429.1 DUF5375 family protein [Escherichia coli]MDY9058654.1 DUF5375 family protein [Escherichia coli]